MNQRKKFLLRAVLGIRHLIGRKKVQAQIKDATNYIQTILSVSPVAIITFKASGENVSVNEAAAKLIGTTVENVRKQNFRQLESWEKSGLLEKALKVINTGQEESLEVRFISTYGVDMWISGRLASFYYEGQQHLLLMAVDISQRQQMELKLRESEKQLHEAQMIAGLGSYVVNVSTGQWKGSDVLDQIFGIDQAYERSVEGWINLIHPDDQARMLDYFKNDVLDLHLAFDKEYRIIRQSDKVERWVHGLGKLEFDFQNKPVNMYGTIQDITERSAAEQGLKESEERYRRLMEAITDYIYTVFFKEGLVAQTVHGPGCEAVTGYTSEEYANDQYLWYQMVHPDDREKVVDLAQRVTNGMAVEPIEHRIIHRSGMIRWLRNTIVVKRDEAGQIISYDGLVFDITDRKQAEEAVRESEARFSTIFRVNPVGVVLIRVSDNKFVNVNNAFSNIFGFTQNEILGRTAIELGIWHNPQDRQRMFSELRSNGLLGQFEGKFIRKSGEEIDLVVSGGLLVISGEEHFLFVAMDITDKKKAQHELKRAAEEWERTFNAIPDMVFIQDKDMNILKVNRACAEVLKLDPKDIIGRKCHEIVHHLGYSWPSCPFEKTRKDHVTHVEEVNDPRLGINLQVTVSPIFDSEEEFIGAVHIAKDITEIKKSQQKEQEHLRELEIFYKGSIGREERILELKEEIIRLKEDLYSKGIRHLNEKGIHEPKD